ncbi:MAG: hypothetical protein VCC00_03135 [Deltaproteobacteria bacterium]
MIIDATANTDASAEKLTIVADSLAQQIERDFASVDTNQGHTTWFTEAMQTMTDDGSVLADSDDKILKDRIGFAELKALFTLPKGFVISKYDGIPTCIAHASSPGYETYATGWHSVILQRLPEKPPKSNR